MTRLMCSERPEEVAAVRSELFKAGIHAEIRKNPVTEALGITRMELWVEKESDYLAAHRIYTRLQTRGRNGHEHRVPEVFVEPAPALAVLAASPTGTGAGRLADLDLIAQGEQSRAEFEKARMLLEKEIDEVLQREESVSAACAALRSEVESLKRSLSESRAAAEKKAAEFATLRSSLERELAERTRSEDQSKTEVRDLQSRLKSSDEAVSEKQRKLESTQHQLQSQQAMVVELRKEIVDLEKEWEEGSRLVSKAHADLAVEKLARIAAEGQAQKSAQALESFEKKLAEQKDSQTQLRASIESMHALRTRLQAKRTSTAS